jgi:exonuclease SbcD
VLGRPRGEDFDAVLAEIVDIAHEARPDLIIHSGDLFDSARPGTAELRRGMRALRELAAIAPTVVLAGNHDSPALLQVMDLVANGFGVTSDPDGVRRITFVDRARRSDSGGILEFPAREGTQRIRLASLPFVHQNRFLDEFRSPETATRDYAAHLRDIQAELARGLLEGYRADRDVLLFAAHLYVEGAVPSYSERPVDIADTYATTAEALPEVGYGALGHIHRPQAVGHAGFTARYAGSPLQMDFGEAGEVKSVVVVDAEPSRSTSVEVVPLHAGRRLAEFTGTLLELRAQAGQIADAFVKATIDTETPTRHLADAVIDALPRATVVRVEERCAASQVTVLDRSAVSEEEPELPELFRAYLAEIGTPGAVAADVLATFKELVAAVDDERLDPLPEEELLRAAVEGRPAHAVDRARLLVPKPRPGSPVSGSTGTSTHTTEEH